MRSRSQSEQAAEHELAAVDMFRSPWAKAFIWVSHSDELETIEILLSLGQRLVRKVPAGRAGHVRLDLVLATILRPALLAAKGAYESLRRGLYEPGQALTRTLLELDLALEYVLAEPATKEQRANRFIAWAYWKRLSALKRQLSEPEVREKLPSDYVEYVEERIRVCQENLEALPEATAENKRQRNWHPYRNMEGLSRHLSRLGDYLHLYAPMSGMFVHAADPETHLNIDDDGHVSIRALATTEPDKLGVTLKLLAGLLHRFLMRFRDEWSLDGSVLGDLLLRSALRVIASHGGEIPAERVEVLEQGSGHRREDWTDAIGLPCTLGAEILEEAVQLLLVVARVAPGWLTEAEIEERTGLVLTTSDGKRAPVLRPILDYLVWAGHLREDATEDETRWRLNGEDKCESPASV